MQNQTNDTLSLFVALVDDEPRIHGFVREVLQSAGVVRRYESFDEPLAFIEFLKNSEEEPDMVLLDVHFQNSGLTGVDILPFIREECPYLPVVLLTGMEGEAIQGAQDFEFTYYIPKPFTPEHLVRMVRFYVGAARRSGRRLADLSRDLDEHKELLDILEKELAEAKDAFQGAFQTASQSPAPTSQRQTVDAKQTKAFDRVKEILGLAMKNCEPMPSFLADLEQVFLHDAKLTRKVVEAALVLDQSSSIVPGHNIHKYIDIDVDNIYSLRLSRKARLFFYRSARRGKNRLLRLDWEHDTPGMVKWARANYSTYGDA